jgi:hypothetical protein
MKEASAQDDSIREGYEIVDLPSTPFPTGYFSHILFTGIMSEGFNRKGDEYDVDFECVIPSNLVPGLLDNTRLRRLKARTWPEHSLRLYSDTSQFVAERWSALKESVVGELGAAGS